MMVTDHFQLMRSLISGELDFQSAEYIFTEGSFKRLYDTLQNFNKVGSRDLVSHIRDILRQEAERQGGIPQTIRVPRKTPWPSEQIWQEVGCEVIHSDEESFTIQANAWTPTWLPLTNTYPPDKRVYAKEYCRNFQSVPGDPFLAEMERTHYRCSGQREAIRAVLSAPPGSTLLVNLPTGAGKSLCAHLPGLLFGKEGGLTVVVVPTTALCIDQERTLAKFIEHPVAYYGGTSPREKERRLGIHERIQNDTQTIVFTSPESLLQSLSGPVYLAARRGELRMLVVDEAHMIDQWGDQFRPAFQELAGMRKKLLQLTEPFLTLMLSATVTESCLDTIQTLFGEPGPFEMVSAVQLRPEPSYWFVQCQDEEVKENRVLEAIHNLPRPLILYVSEVEHANAWIRRLKEVGYRRCEVMTGSTDTSERIEIINQWRDCKLDIIVATSAFGLGVDQADVRTVIHACVPENVDRYYQEVGRGGRDGRACISLVLYTEEDLGTAESLNEKKLITIKRGLTRWQRMFSEKESIKSGWYRVPVDIAPSLNPEDIDMQGSYNEAWNIRVLTLMGRAGLIQLEGELPNYLTEKDNMEVVQEPRKTRVVRILNERHLDIETWLKHIEVFRKKSNHLASRSLKLMEDILAGEKCVGNILKEMYTVQQFQNRPGVMVSASCGGCPACRGQGEKTYAGLLHATTPDWSYLPVIGDELRRIMGSGNLVVIFYHPSEGMTRREKMRWHSIIRWFFAQGMKNLVAPPKWQEELWETLQKIPGKYIFTFGNFEPLQMPKLPTLELYGEGPVTTRLFCSDTFQKGSIPRVILLPVTTLDPNKDNCLYVNTVSCKKYLFEEFCTEVGL